MSDLIADVRVVTCRIAPTVSWEDATHRVGALEYLIVTIETAAGRRGTGLSYTVGVGATAVQALIVDYCRSRIVGGSADQPAHTTRLLRRHLARTGCGGVNTLALAAIDTALWDLAAESAGQSLAAHFGASRTKLPAYASGIDLAMSVDELAADIQGRLDRGYQAVKIKVGRPTLREDVERISTVREILGDDRDLYLDANQAWRIDEALVRVRAFERFRPGWIEEPLDPGDIDGHADLRHRTGVPIAIGESLYSATQFLQYLRADAVDILQPDVARVGGFGEWLQIAHLARTWSKSVSAHFLSELSVHAMCAVDNALILEDVRGGSLYELGLARAPVVTEGIAHVPSRLGIGLQLDDGALDANRLSPEILRTEGSQSSKM